LAFLAKACIGLLKAAARLHTPRAFEPAAAGAARRVIHLYQQYLSSYADRRCLFRVSCSEYAARALAAEGWKGGLEASLTRVQRCGGSYSLSSDIHGRITLVAGDGTEFSDDELANWILPIPPTRRQLDSDPAR
jgi:putative component of membrane protein insertase Oxa1/YidC/SpoIIIJ protein YidD